MLLKVGSYRLCRGVIRGKALAYLNEYISVICSPWLRLKPLIRQTHCCLCLTTVQAGPVGLDESKVTERT